MDSHKNDLFRIEWAHQGLRQTTAGHDSNSFRRKQSVELQKLTELTVTVEVVGVVVVIAIGVLAIVVVVIVVTVVEVVVVDS